jgi:hypothetical protein
MWGKGAWGKQKRGRFGFSVGLRSCHDPSEESRKRRDSPGGDDSVRKTFNTEGAEVGAQRKQRE